MSVDPAPSRTSTTRVKCWSLDAGRLPAEVDVAHFAAPDGADEYHFVVRPSEYADFATQLGWVEAAYRQAVREVGLGEGTTILRRFLCSDLPNQAGVLKARPFANPQEPDEPCGISWVRQPPMPPQKIVLWAWHTTDGDRPLEKTLADQTLSLRRGELTHHFTVGLNSHEEEASYDQTYAIFDTYDRILNSHGLSLADQVIRTWLFVQNVDANYKGLVIARRQLFAHHGLTAQTHYIASTGIEGTHDNVAAKVLMDAYAIEGVRPEQIQFLEALDHLCPTGIYGVTFERATAVAYRDRKHVFMSGTASIDHNGYILHPGDVGQQLDRALENVEALLKPAGAVLGDMASWLVYLRDISDLELARAKMRERCGNVPMAVVVAPVCRPGWLIEIEGIAVLPSDNPELPAW